MFDKNPKELNIWTSIIFLVLSVNPKATVALLNSTDYISGTKVYTTQIPQRLTYGDTVSILGRYLASTRLIEISFPTYADSKDIAFLVSFKMEEHFVVRNSYVNGKWGKEETYGGFPLSDDGMFDLTVYFFDDYYHVVIGADHFCRFPVRVPLSHTNFMVIVGLDEVEKVAWDQGCKC